MSVFPSTASRVEVTLHRLGATLTLASESLPTIYYIKQVRWKNSNPNAVSPVFLKMAF
jgi:uncharacterized protein YjdB